jgi:hypothetical protein
MRTVLLLLVAAGATLSATSAQVRYDERTFQQYYDWFQSVSPASALRQHGAGLYVFSPATPLRAAPCLTGTILTRLPIGSHVTNIVDQPYDSYPDEINGYADRWFRVRARTADYGWIEGYIWGSHIARAWTWVELEPAARPVFAMLGLGSQPIEQLAQMQGEIRLVDQQTLLYRQPIEKMCLFRQCYSQALLRVLPDQPRSGQVLLEATSVISNCEGSSIDKAIFAWTDNGLLGIHHAEYISGHTYSQRPLPIDTETDQPLECSYQGEDQYFNPVWSCRPLPAGAKARRRSPQVTRAR